TRDSERVQMLQALGAFRDPHVIRQALDLIPSPGVTPSGALDLLITVSTNPIGGRELFDWYRSRSKALSEMWAGTPLLSLFRARAWPGSALTKRRKWSGTSWSTRLRTRSWPSNRAS